jgi:hypothetical protein
MKKTIAITTILMFCLSFLAIAGPDLTITHFQLADEVIVPGEKHDYVIEITNVGDETARTRLPNHMYFGENPALSTGSLTQTLGTRDGSVMETVTILPDIEVIPELDDVTYMGHEESEEQIQKRISNMMERANSLGWTEEQIQTETAEIQEMFGNPHEKTASGFFIDIAPGEIARYESTKSYNGFGRLHFPTTSLSIEPIPITLTIEIDPERESDDNINNNVYTQEIVMAPNVIQGPMEETEKNRELDDENEYFAYALGCTTIQGKEICVSGDDPNVPDEEEMLIISVDDVEQEYSLYGLMMSWLNQLFGNGKLAPTETVNGVEITIYDNGFKLAFV